MAINDPRDISGLLLWYSAEAEAEGGLGEGAALSTWTDQSPNGNHATATGTPPSLRLTEGMSGAQAVKFNGDGYFSVPVSPTGVDAEIFAWVKGDTGGRWQFGVYTDTMVNGVIDGAGYIRDTFGGVSSTTSTNQGVQFRSIQAPGASAPDPTLWRTYNVARDDHYWKWWSNGTAMGNNNNDFNITNASGSGYPPEWAANPVIGAGYVNGSSIFYGYLAGVILFDRRLTDAERADMNAWMIANPGGGVKYVPPVIVAGEAWAADASNEALGTALTEVIVRGDAWHSDLVALAGQKLVKGDPWAAGSTLLDGTTALSSPVAGESSASGNTMLEGTARLSTPVSGDSWSADAGALDGDAKTQVVVRGDAWAGSAASQGGTTILEPEPPYIDTEASPTGTYRYLVFDIMTDELLAELQMNDVSFSLALGSVGDLTGTVYAVDSQPDIDLFWATMPMKTAIYVLRGDKGVWGGIIWNREYDVGTKEVRISAGTWESYLYRRYIWHTFETRDDIDQYQVVRRLLMNMRGDFTADIYDLSEDNVTPMPMSAAVDIYSDPNAVAGKTQASILFDRTEMKSFGEAIEEYAAQEDGFEWYFWYDYNKNAQRFRRRIHFLPTPPSLMKKGSPPLTDTEADKPGIDTFLFEYPGNVVSATLVEDADNAATRQFVMGGPPEGVNLEGVKPIGSWNNTNYLNKGFPLVENVESSKHATTWKLKRLNKLARIYGQETTPPIRRWSVTAVGSMDPIVGTYRLGHWCRLVIDDDFVRQSLELAGQNQDSRGVVKRIIGISVQVPDGPQLPETVTLELEDDIVVSNELADTVDDDGNPLPPVAVTLYPTGDLVAEPSSGGAGSPKINGSTKQWSDSSGDTWGQVYSWTSGSSADWDSNAIRAKIEKSDTPVAGRSVSVRVNLQAMDERSPQPYSFEIRNRTTGEVCLVAYTGEGITSTNPKTAAWTMAEVGGGTSSFETWLASGDAELRVESAHAAGPDATGTDQRRRIRIYEVRIVVS